MRWLLVLTLAACGAPKPAVTQPAPLENVAPPKRTGDAVFFDEDEHAYIDALLRELRVAGERARHPRLLAFVEAVTELLRRADHDGLTKEQLLRGMRDAEDAMPDAVSAGVTQQIDDLREVMRRAKQGPRRSPFGP